MFKKGVVVIVTAIALLTAFVVGRQMLTDWQERPEDYFDNPATLALAQAIMANDRNEVSALIASGADINAAEADGLTLLHWQVLRNDTSRTKMILDLGGNPEAQSLHGETAVHIAATKRTTDMLELLLDNGASPNVIGKRLGRSPIFVALDAKSADHIELLIAHGAEINFVDSTGSTPLSHAAMINASAYVRRFLELGADPEAVNDLGVTFQPAFFRTDPTIMNGEALQNRRWVEEFLVARGIAVQRP